MYRSLLEIRSRVIAPRLRDMGGGARYTAANHLLQAEWTLGDRSRLRLIANLRGSARARAADGSVLYASIPDAEAIMRPSAG